MDGVLVWAGSSTRTGEGCMSALPESVSIRELLSALDHEVAVISIIAADMLERKSISEMVWTRLATAASRIGAL